MASRCRLARRADDHAARRTERGIVLGQGRSLGERDEACCNALHCGRKRD